MTAKFVVIGGGTAGWCAARRAQQLGVDVTVLERSPVGPGDTRAGPRVHAAYQTPFRDPDELYDIMMKKGDGALRENVVRAWADNTGRALQFMIDEGNSTHRDGDPPFCWNAWDDWPEGEQPTNVQSFPAGFGRSQMSGTHRTLTTMWQNFVREGGEFLSSTRARSLVMKNGKVSGVGIETADGSRSTIAADAVLMCDGGWAASKELMAKYVTPEYRQLGSDYPQGDCLLMALTVGAKVVNMDACYANVGVRDLPDRPAPMVGGQFLHLNDIIDASIVVDGNATRVGDESKGMEDFSIIDIQLAGAVFHSATPEGCWAIFDHAAWEGEPGTAVAGPLFPDARGVNPVLLETNAPLLIADTLADLAKQTGLPLGPLGHTVAGFNAHARDGVPIDPPRLRRPAPVEVAPFYALPLRAGIYYTMGGPLIDEHARVLDEQESPIAGLYCAGTSAGGLEGGPHNAYAGGWSNASTTGILAAEHVAEYLANA